MTTTTIFGSERPVWLARVDVRGAGTALRGALLGALALIMTTGCFDYGGDAGATSQAGSTPAPGSGPVAGANPGVGVGAFDTTVYPLLTQYCGTTCHIGGGTSGTPLISHPDLDTAYRAVVDNQKVNLSVPASSRLVRRLVADQHHCWTSDCDSDGAEMETAVAVWAQMVVDAGGGTQVGDGLTSNSLTLADGVEDLGDERYSDGMIAFWDFKEGSGNVAFDKSGVAPAMDLSIQGPSWMTNYGIDIETGRAIATAVDSAKLFDRIASPNGGTQQYSVEAWVIPDNTDQEGPARIVSYSAGTNLRNFTLGQVLYTYDFRNRTIDPEISDNGTPSLRTYDADEDLQATLQHVVMTYDQVLGRRIFVNSQFTDDMDEFEATRLWNWGDNHRFVLGNELGNERQWVGKIQLVAVYEHALSDAAIRQNFDAGVGKRLVMRFDVSQWIGPGSFIEFNVSELDAASYLFCSPALLTTNPSGFRVANLRISVNGQIPVVGQAFVNVDQIVTSSRQELSSTCSIIAKDQGALTDLFAIEFEVLGGFENPIVVPDPPAPPPEVFGAALPTEGVRDFARINESMAGVTGVDPNTQAVLDTFSDLEQQLPSGADLRAFSSSHQVGIAKLALEYCDQMVGTPGLLDGFFGPGALTFTGAVLSDLSDQSTRDFVIQSLVDGMLGDSLTSQPDATEVGVVLNTLFDDLGCTQTCTGSRAETVVKGACAAVLGSAAVTLH